MIYRHPDGTYHRHKPHTAEPKLEPIPGRPNWWRNPRTGEESYLEPGRPFPDLVLS